MSVCACGSNGFLVVRETVQTADRPLLSRLLPMALWASLLIC